MSVLVAVAAGGLLTAALGARRSGSSPTSYRSGSTRAGTPSRRSARSADHRTARAWFVVLGAYALVIVPLLAVFWEAWAIEVLVIAAAAVVTLLTSRSFLFVGPRGLPAVVRAFFSGRIDPDEANAYVQEKYTTSGTSPARVAGTISKRTRAVGDYLLPRVGSRKGPWANKLISEAGNSDTPPMFKNFLHMNISPDGTKLEITCHGVTGWAAHEGSPGNPLPVEDHVEIDLTQGGAGATSRPGGPRRRAATARRRRPSRPAASRRRRPRRRRPRRRPS